MNDHTNTIAITLLSRAEMARLEVYRAHLQAQQAGRVEAPTLDDAAYILLMQALTVWEWRQASAASGADTGGAMG
jgi:hypothetical protein